MFDRQNVSCFLKRSGHAKALRLYLLWLLGNKSAHICCHWAGVIGGVVLLAPSSGKTADYGSQKIGVASVITNTEKFCVRLSEVVMKNWQSTKLHHLPTALLSSEWDAVNELQTHLCKGIFLVSTLAAALKSVMLCVLWAIEKEKRRFFNLALETLYPGISLVAGRLGVQACIQPVLIFFSVVGFYSVWVLRSKGDGKRHKHFSVFTHFVVDKLYIFSWKCSHRNGMELKSNNIDSPARCGDDLISWFWLTS